ncbi:NifU family protein, partial [Fusobacterium nucleatum]
MDKIEKFLDKEIRPYLKSHGGDIEIINYSIEKKELNLRLKGQCCVCPHSIETNENFI